MVGRHHLVLALNVSVLALFIGNGASDSVCPNGMTNITAISGSLKYPDSGTYGKNETKCWSITVPDAYDSIFFRFSSLDIERCTTRCECDYVQYSSAASRLKSGEKFCGRYSYNYLHEHLLPVIGSAGSFEETVSGSTVFFRFRSDDAAHYKGFNLTFIAASGKDGKDNCLNASDGETITFGTPKVGIQSYPSNYMEKWILIVPEGRQVQIAFEIFDLEDSEDCKNDHVEFREAFIVADNYFTGYNGPILTKPLCGSTKPNSIQSQGNMVWVRFKSDRNSTTVYKGFKASFKAGQGRLSASHLLSLLFLSALIVQKINLF